MPLEIGFFSNLLMAAFFGLGCFLGIHSAILLVEIESLGTAAAGSPPSSFASRFWAGRADRSIQRTQADSGFQIPVHTSSTLPASAVR